jgi:GNAT superfamily N-acetyltransferase
LGPWRADRDIAQLGPVPGTASPDRSLILRALSVLAAEGYDQVLTTALSLPEAVPFLDAGFEVRAELVLLSADLSQPPVAPAHTVATVRRPRRSEWAVIAELDTRAFPAFWHLDTDGIAEALAATPSSRLRVAEVGHALAGYAASGRAGSRGYLQRLAVAPEAQGRGVGRALVVDSLRWMRRRGATRAFVNTQHDNTVALGLYESIGFTREPNGLLVLGTRLPAGDPR